MTKLRKASFRTSILVVCILPSSPLSSPPYRCTLFLEIYLVRFKSYFNIIFIDGKNSPFKGDYGFLIGFWCNFRIPYQRLSPKTISSNCQIRMIIEKIQKLIFYMKLTTNRFGLNNLTISRLELEGSCKG